MVLTLVFFIRDKIRYCANSSSFLPTMQLFGFKNPLVKKLLRELKANFGQPTEHSLPSTCSGNGQSEGTHQHHTRRTGYDAEACKSPDLQVKSVKPKGKERSKKRKEVNVKMVSGTEHKRGRPQDLTQSGEEPHCRQSCEGNHNKGIPSCLPNSNENNTGPETMAYTENNLSHLASAKHGVHSDSSVSSEHLEKEKFPAAQEATNSGQEVSSVSSEHLEKEKFPAAQEATNSVSSKGSISFEERINLLKDQENRRNDSSQLDVSMFTNASGITSSKTVDKKGDPPVQKDSQMLDDVDLYAPDTLDLTLDSTFNCEEIPKENNCTREDKLNGVQISVSPKCITESQSKDDIVIASGSENSEKSDSDLVGQDIAKSMMTLLLPRALPLLKTFSRKKKNFPNRGKKDLPAMSQEERKGTDQCLEDNAPAKSSEQIQLEKLNGDVHIPDRLFTENFETEKQNGNVLLPSTDMSSLVPGLEDSTTVAPDSYEDTQCEIKACSQIGQVHNAVAGPTTFGIDLSTHEGDHACPNIRPREEVLHIETAISKTKSNQDVNSLMEKSPQRGGKIISNYDLGNISQSRNDLCTNIDAPLSETYPEPTNVKISPCHTEEIATRVDAKSTSAVGFDYAAQKRTRGVAGGVGAGNMSSMPSADHVAEKGARCFTAGVGDGSVSFTPVCKDSKGEFITEVSATDVSASGSQIDKMRPDEKIYRLPNVRIPTGSNGSSCLKASVATPHDDDVPAPNYKFTSDVCGASVNCERQTEASSYTELFEIRGGDDIDVSISISQDQGISDYDMTKLVHNDENAKDESCLKELTKMVHNDELENIFEFVGCYLHPTPISMVMLKTKGNEVFICVLCGYLMEKARALFVYKASIKGEKRGCPSFIGHSTIISPISRNACGGQIMLDSSSLQFTPDGTGLVLLNDIKTPYCRFASQAEGNVNCQCSACTSDCSAKNAVKVVEVKLGYVEAVCKLETITSVCCILVCEPSYLVAAEESGRMNLWTMNSTWRLSSIASTEHSYLPTSDCMSNYIVEMKRMPNFPALIIGHSVFGDFCLDLTRRILVSKFSAKNTSFLPFLPINVFRCPSQPLSGTDDCMKKQVSDIMGETQTWSLERDNKASVPVEEEDLSLVLLVSSVSNLDLKDERSNKDSGVSPVGCWSLALLAKSKMLSEIALDPSATVVGASAGYGIIGTCDGSLYIWELSTGTKLGYLSRCIGAKVSCLAVDDSDCGAFGVAVDGSQLQQVNTHTRSSGIGLPIGQSH
ncbi:hypothetical protein OSB04_008902 [Centaurea solstitialis]|uniref:FYR C-terminal domain-containing protein n=1 Tax=Centaurea solstitialis TaxID=347529 RepID=A0AA38U600_9ASTR|nr:hypothetical protein OSB04_008902 [Centaurea solstitialis]